MILIGIESSCDETAASIVFNGVEILSSVVASQTFIHREYGGVVPELASRKHIEFIVSVVDEAIAMSGIKIRDIDGVAVTQGPGLVGSLLVGFSFAKGFCFSNNIPFIGVDHLEGHINSVFLGSKFPNFPFVALVVSGGHTGIYYVSSHCDYELMGQTRDDAVGEAYDKVGKMMGFEYPGGKAVSKLARKGNHTRFVFKRPFLDKSSFDFSFSGIKTAVYRTIFNNLKISDDDFMDIAAGFQESVIDVLSYKIVNAAVVKNCKSIVVVGGVAANKRLRDVVNYKASKKAMNAYMPSVDLCGDNAAMIASIGYHYLNAVGKTVLWTDDVYSRCLKKII